MVLPPVSRRACLHENAAGVGQDERPRWRLAAARAGPTATPRRRLRWRELGAASQAAGAKGRNERGRGAGASSPTGDGLCGGGIVGDAADDGHTASLFRDDASDHARGAVDPWWVAALELPAPKPPCAAPPLQERKGSGQRSPEAP